MRTVPIKSTVAGVSLAAPGAKAGWANRDVLIYHVTECPDDVPLPVVLRAFVATTIVVDPSPNAGPLYAVPYASLAPGVIVYVAGERGGAIRA